MPHRRTGDFHVEAGGECAISCQRGLVSLEEKRATCVNGDWSSRLRCVRPDALILIGGRSDTYGVLDTVELVTGQGVCRGAVPPLPAMRWRTITSAISRDKVRMNGS